MKEKKNLIFMILAGFGLYLLTTGVSYAVFGYIGPQSSGSGTVALPTAGPGGLRVDLSAPKTEECPLNGEKYTKAEKDIWSKRRPLMVMIENHQDARPQSGLSRADVIYEAVAEGGITRFMTVFYCGAAAQDVQVGPVRSARTYFLDFASEYSDYPLYAHVGGANSPGPANALGQIGDYGWLKKGNDMNQFSIGFPTYWRDKERLGREVATEHTMYSTADKLYDVANKRGLNNVDSDGKSWDAKFVKWTFKDDANPANRGNISPEFSFWKGHDEYNVRWTYNSESNDYSRMNGGVAHKDRNDDSQLKTKSVVVAFMKESRANDGYENNLHLIYGDKGTGKIVMFQDGQAIEGTWEKKDRVSRMIFKDSKGKEIKFDRGRIWVEIIPVGSEVKY
ncbi:MAG: DUF3048 domain-containing protein [bacterium]|nr:DUF3048 domain-containing protein [bacterium]